MELVNVPHLREDMLEIGMRPSLLVAVSLVLYFSVVAMFAFAVRGLAGAVSLLRGAFAVGSPLDDRRQVMWFFGFVAFVQDRPERPLPGLRIHSEGTLLVALGADYVPWRSGKWANGLPCNRQTQLTRRKRLTLTAPGFASNLTDRSVGDVRSESVSQRQMPPVLQRQFESGGHFRGAPDDPEPVSARRGRAGRSADVFPRLIRFAMI